MSVSNSTSVTKNPFRPLRFITLRTARQVSIESLPPVPAEIQRNLDDKEWLLESGQHVTFPPSLIDEMADKRIFTPSDFVSIIERATNDDLHAAAFDPDNGKRRQLNSDQWNEMKVTGEVTIPSILFENQNHRWRLARGFYSGIRAIQESFTAGIGKMLDHWIIYAPRWILGRSQKEFEEGDRWSVVRSLRLGTWRAASTFVSALDQIWGSPLQHQKYSKNTIDRILDCAENAYVMHHLKKENLDVPPLISQSFILDVFQHSDTWNALESDAAWDRDFRPNSSDFESQRQAFKLLESVRQGFEEAMTDKRSALFNLREEKTFASPKAAMAELQTAESDWSEQMEAAWDHELRTNTRLGNIGQVQANQNQARRMQKDLKQADAKVVEKEREALRVELGKKHPILSLSSEWLQNKLLEFEKKKMADMEASRPTRLVARLREANLVSPAREQELRQEFQAKLKAPIQKQLQSQRLPCPPAEFKVPIFHPGKWHYTNDLYAASCSSTEIGQGYFRRISFTWITVVGHVKRNRDVHVHVGHRFWRFNYTHKLFLSRTMSYLGGCYHFLVSGPLSLRALLSKDPFFAYKRFKSNMTETATLVGGQRERSQQVFDLEDDPSSFTPTLYSRLASFCEATAQVRARFEASPDTGLIGKHIQRIFLRGYLFVKGVVGTTIISVFMVVGSLLATAITLVGVLLAPVLAIATVVVETLFHLLVFDIPQMVAMERSYGPIGDSWLHHEPAEPNLLGPVPQMVILAPFHVLAGCLVSIYSAVSGILVHPFLGSIQLFWTSATLVLRFIRDTLTWNLIIRPAANVPASDSFLAKRIHGPGLASEYYYRIPLESAQTTVRLSLDSNRIHAYAKLQEAEIMEPFSRYNSLFETALKPFGIQGEFTEQGPNKVRDTMIKSWLESNRLPYYAGDWNRMDNKLPVPTDGWDSLGQGIRSANPDYMNLQQMMQRAKWDRRKVSTHWPGMDTKIMNSLQERVISDTTIVRQYKLMASRAGHLLAELFLRQYVRDSRIVQFSAMPPQSRGRFRLSKSELDQLWKFTLEQTEKSLTTLEQELLEYAKNSTFADVLLPKERDIMNEFYTAVGGRPGMDTPLVAANLLTTLFGTDAIHATLEDVDQTMVLMPKRSELDRHYNFGLFGNSEAWNRLYE